MPFHGGTNIFGKNYRRLFYMSEINDQIMPKWEGVSLIHFSVI